MLKWILTNQHSSLGGDVYIKILGTERKVTKYHFYINDILSRNGGGWYTDNERNMLNELRERYITNSMDIHYVDGVWIYDI